MQRPAAWERGPLLAFFAMTFAITWSLGAMVLVFGDPLARVFGEMDLRRPFWKLGFHVAGYAPAISAFTVVGALHGREGLRLFGRRLLRWRTSAGWWAVALLGFPALQLAASSNLGLVWGLWHLPAFRIHAIGNFYFGVEGASTPVEMGTRTVLGLLVVALCVWRLGARNLSRERVTTYLAGRVTG